MQIELVTIGDELLLGFTLDSNGAHIARELAAIGVSVVRRTSVGDDAERIAAVVREALDRTGGVITTGGLGPTSDDLTNASVAAVFGRSMHLDEDILEALRQRWTARGWGKDMPASNRQQALVPEGATILTNRHGTAPGIWLEDDAGRWVATLPGVPREMRGMFSEEVLPRVAARAGAGPGASAPSVVLSRTIRTTGIAESLLADRIHPIEGQLAGLSLAYLPGWPGVDLRLTSQERSRADALALLDTAEGAIRSVVGVHTYGTESDDLAATVVAALADHRASIVVAESCTGGLLGGRISAVPGASHVFVGGVIAYSNAVKSAQLGVGDDTLRRFGAVSEEVAREMAAGARARFGTDVGVSVTGVAGPGGGTPDKPVGTVCVAVDLRRAVASARRVMVGDRQEVRLRSTQWALDLVRRALRSA